MSAQKQQQQGSGTNRSLEADFLFNQHIVRIVGYTAAGFGFGLASSLLFKHKAGMTMFFSGAGAGYGASNLFNDLNQYRRYKSLGQNQGQQYQRDGSGFEQLGERGSQLAAGLQSAKNQAQNKLEQGAQNLKEKGKDLADQTKDGLQNAKDQAKNTADNVANKAKEGAQNAKDQAKNAADQASNKTNEGLQNVKDQAKNLAGQAKNAAENVKDQAKNAAENLKDKASDAANKAKNSGENLKDQAKNAWENVKDQAQNAAGQAKNAAENVKDQAKSAAGQAKNAGENLKDQAKNAAENVKDQAKNAAGQAKNSGENLKDQAKNAAENVKDKAKNAAENVKDKASESTDQPKSNSKEWLEQQQKRIDETVPNLKEQGKSVGGGTSRQAGGDPYNRPSSSDARKADESAQKVASSQKAKNTAAHGNGTTAQGDPKEDSTERLNGQTFQSFDSNTHKEGKAGMIHEIQTNYQENRNRFREQAANENRTNLTRQGQDPYFKSETEGIGRVNDMKSDTQMGAHNYTHATEQLKGNKIETDASRSEHGKVA